MVVILSAEMPRARHGRRLEKGGSDADININVRATPRRTSTAKKRFAPGIHRITHQAIQECNFDGSSFGNDEEAAVAVPRNQA